uniref:ZP domain-containing protein n=1 Tax=Poecilia reticulata TaxID=8081 RepID=A0A3P9PKQ1_POERE
KMINSLILLFIGISSPSSEHPGLPAFFPLGVYFLLSFPVTAARPPRSPTAPPRGSRVVLPPLAAPSLADLSQLLSTAILSLSSQTSQIPHAHTSTPLLFMVLSSSIVPARWKCVSGITYFVHSFSFGGGPNCAPIGTTSAFAIYQFPVTACGTVITSENVMYSYEVAVGPYGTITRDSCLSNADTFGTSVEALVIEVGPGPLRVELRIGNGVFASKGCLEDPVYVEVRILERTDPIVLTLGRCWTSTSPFLQNLSQWDLLVDGCPCCDDNYLTNLIPLDGSTGLPYPTHYRCFVFKMFTFVSDPSPTFVLQVYIPCDAAVCQPSATNSWLQKAGCRSLLTFPAYVAAGKVSSLLHFQVQALCGICLADPTQF